MKLKYSVILFAVSCISAVSAAEPWSALVSPSNSLEFKLLKGETPVAHATVIGWGPNWQWVGVHAGEKAKTDSLDVTTQFVVNKSRREFVDIRFQVHSGVWRRSMMSNRSRSHGTCRALTGR